MDWEDIVKGCPINKSQEDEEILVRLDSKIHNNVFGFKDLKYKNLKLHGFEIPWFKSSFEIFDFS